MQFLKWKSSKKIEKLEDRVLQLEEQNISLIDQMTKQNEAIQEIVLCVKQLAITDQSMYSEIMAMSAVLERITGIGQNVDDYFFDLEKDEDEYLN